MKKILANKKKLGEYETVALIEKRSSIFQKKLPLKLKDLGSFTILCSIRNVIFERSICDLGASIILMPLSIIRRLRLVEERPTTLTLQLADQFLKHLRGIIENVLVKVDKFLFPTDFIVSYIKEDKKNPIILGRPLLAIRKALIDVQKGELKLRVKEEEVIFHVFKATRHLDDWYDESSVIQIGSNDVKFGRIDKATTIF